MFRYLISSLNVSTSFLSFDFLGKFSVKIWATLKFDVYKKKKKKIIIELKVEVWKKNKLNFSCTTDLAKKSAILYSRTFWWTGFAVTQNRSIIIKLLLLIICFFFWQSFKFVFYYTFLLLCCFFSQCYFNFCFAN